MRWLFLVLLPWPALACPPPSAYLAGEIAEASQQIPALKLAGQRLVSLEGWNPQLYPCTAQGKLTDGQIVLFEYGVDARDQLAWLRMDNVQ